MVITVVVPRSSIDVLIEALVVMVNALTSRFVTTTTGSGLTEAGRLRPMPRPSQRLVRRPLLCFLQLLHILYLLPRRSSSEISLRLKYDLKKSEEFDLNWLVQFVESLAKSKALHTFACAI